MDPITLLILVALLVASELLRPKPKTESARPPGLGDFSFPTAEQGRPIPVIWGRVLLQGPNVVWYGDLRSDVISIKQKTGLFSSQRMVTGFKYHIGMQLGLCRGMDGIRQVWIGDQRVKDASTLSTSSFDIDLPNLFNGDSTTGRGGVQATVTVYLGTNVQTADPYLANFQDAGSGTNRTPAYRGTAYLVVRELGHTAGAVGGAYLGNETSIQPWKLEAERYAPIFSGQSSGDNKVNSNADLNTANAAYEFMTNTEWGMGIDPSLMDVGAVSSFKTASDAMIAEQNGFSMILDTSRPKEDVRAEIERQMGGVIIWDHTLGKHVIRLARADYDVNTVKQISPANVLEVQNFARASWTDTTNFVPLKFNNRVNDYKEDFALAIDSANAQVQGGGSIATALSVPASVDYPGVKDATLAAQLAWRDLRSLSYPLARADFVLDRSFWAVKAGDVLAWTDPKYGFVKLPMRVQKVDYGDGSSSKITVGCVQDVFYFAAKSFGAPPATRWTPPTATLVAYPANEQGAMEAPRAIVERDPVFSGDITASKVLAFARKQGGESTFLIGERHSAGSPSGAFVAAGEVVNLVHIGALASNLVAGTAIPTSTITITPSPDSQAVILSLFDPSTTIETMGKDLAQVVLVGNEFMLVKLAAANAGNVDLQTVYRGVMDTPQQAHSSGDKVYLMFSGAGLTDKSFVSTDNVDLELRARGPQSTYAGAVTTVSLTMDRRTTRPNPVATFLFDGSSTSYGTPNLQFAGSGLNALHTTLGWYRRDYRVGDEVLALLSDGTTVDSSTMHQVEVRADPTGANTLVGSISAYANGVGPVSVFLADVVTAAALGTTLRFYIRTEHVFGGLTLTNRYDATFDVVPTSGTYSGKFYMGGGLAANVSSNSYTAAATGTFTLNIGALQATANIQVSVNGGGFATVIAAGATTGTFSATSGQTIVVRRTVSEAPNPNFVELRNPSNVVVAYGSFKT